MYHAIARHYKWAIDRAFAQNPLYNEIIILEEDIEVAPDFFDYFDALRTRLHSQKHLYCVSAFNDNGHARFVKDESGLHLSDFFPGLGWMMTRAMWQELGPKWPLGYPAFSFVSLSLCLSHSCTSHPLLSLSLCLYHHYILG